MSNRSRYSPIEIPALPKKDRRARTPSVATVSAPEAKVLPAESPVPAEVPAVPTLAPVVTPPVQLQTLDGHSARMKKLNEALAPIGQAMQEKFRAEPLVPNPNAGGQNAEEQRRADRLALVLGQQQSRSDDFHKELEKFYRTGSLQGAMSRDDWLKSDTGRFEDTLAGRLTTAIRSSSAVGARRLELSRAMQAGLGDPTLARGSHQREQARMQGVRQAEREARDAEKARADAYYSWWRSQNQARRDAKRNVDDAGKRVKAAYLGGFTGGFRIADNGRHERSAVASADKLELVAKSFGL